MRDNAPGSALILPRLHDRHDGQLHVVAVDPILADAALAGGENVAVEPQAVGRIVQIDASQGRGIGDVEGNDHVWPLAPVRQVGDDGRGRVEVELIGDRLLCA